MTTSIHMKYVDSAEHALKVRGEDVLQEMRSGARVIDRMQGEFRMDSCEGMDSFSLSKDGGSTWQRTIMGKSKSENWAAEVANDMMKNQRHGTRGRYILYDLTSFTRMWDYGGDFNGPIDFFT